MVRESREVLGVIYPSLSAAAKAYDKDPDSVRQRVYRGLNIHDALFLPNRRNKPIRVHGEDYPSRAAVAREFGIDERTFYSRIRRVLSPEEAVDRDIQENVTMTVDGITYPSIASAAEEWGQVYKLVYKRKKLGWSPEQAAGIDPPPEFKKGVAPIRREEYIERLHLVHGDDPDFTHSDFNRAQDKVKVRCAVDDRHPIFTATPNNLLRGRGCPICKASYGEREIALWLDDHEIPFEREWTDHDIRGENPRARMRFDFLIPDQKVFIEFDGQQHFEPVTFGRMSENEAEEALERTQTNDRLKDEWALSNGHTMLRIRYDENVPEKLSSFFGLSY